MGRLENSGALSRRTRQLCAVTGWRMVALALYATAMDKSLFEASPLASAFCGTIVPCWTQCNARPFCFPAFRPVFPGNKNAGLARLRGGAADKDFAYEFREQGLELLAAGATAAALAAYEKAVEIAPTDADSLVALGRLLDQVRGNQQHAFDLFVRAVECAPDNLVVLSNYAFGLENWCDRPLLAENVYRRAEALDPSNVPVLINLASLLEQPLPERDPRYNTEAEASNLRKRESHKLYERALALEPTNRNTLCNYAGMLMTWGDQGDCSESGMQRGGERAAELFERALVLAPNDPAVLINYGVLMEDWGDNKELARHLYQKAVDADPASSAAVCSLARILRVLQRLDEAQDVVCFFFVPVIFFI